MRVWFSGRTLPCQGRDAVSITATRTMKNKGIFERGGEVNFEFVPDTRAGDELNQEVKTGSLHNSNLYDLNETPLGEKTDLSTGETIDNSTFLPEEDLSVYKTGSLESVDGVNRKVWEVDDSDEAGRWLKENNIENNPKKNRAA